MKTILRGLESAPLLLKVLMVDHVHSSTQRTEGHRSLSSLGLRKLGALVPGKVMQRQTIAE